MTNIDRVLALLSWDCSLDEQTEGLKLARQTECLKCFFQPLGNGIGKDCWENCAVVVCEHTDEELQPYVLDMLLWLEDLNWPGAGYVQRRLTQFLDVRLLAVVLNKMVPALSVLNEESWLISLSVLLENERLRKRLSDEALRTLSQYRI